MIDQQIIYAVQTKLFACTALTAVVGNNIAFARGPIEGKWPQVHFFSVSPIEGYQVDFNKDTIQMSIWSLDKWEPLSIKEIIYNEFKHYKGKITTSLGVVDFTWTELIDSGALPEADPTLFGEYLRFKFRYRGANLGGL